MTIGALRDLDGARGRVHERQEAFRSTAGPHRHPHVEIGSCADELFGLDCVDVDERTPHQRCEHRGLIPSSAQLLQCFVVHSRKRSRTDGDKS